MSRRSRNLLGAFLPLLLLLLCQASGVGSSPVTAVTPAAVDAPAISNNAPPSIVIGEIADAEVGATFAYQPVTQDPESDALQFTAVNLPPWASLNPITGHISGTPGPSDAGLYESISITVADATHVVVTAPFSIVVNAAVAPAVEPTPESGSGVASIRWELPPSKVSGEPLDDLVGYRILYGRNSSELDQSVMVPDPSTTSYQISNLASGVWYFAVVAVNASGLEGPPTTFASKLV